MAGRAERMPSVIGSPAGTTALGPGCPRTPGPEARHRCPRTPGLVDLPNLYPWPKPFTCRPAGEKVFSTMHQKRAAEAQAA